MDCPDRPLSSEITAVLEAGYLRGADLWHVAVALYHAEDPREVTFVTLDNRQRAVAAALGFRTDQKKMTDKGTKIQRQVLTCPC